MLKPLLPGADVAVEARVTMDMITWSASARRSATESWATEIQRRAVPDSKFCSGAQGCFECAVMT